MPHLHLPLPLAASLLEWSAFSLVWRAAARRASPPVQAESPASRRRRLLLLNLAFLLAILPARIGIRRLPAAGWLPWLGLSLQTAFFALAVWARRHLSSLWSGEIALKSGHTLVQSGPYRSIRHPIYTAMLGMLLGSALVSGQALAFVGLALAGLAYRHKIRREEAVLHQAFGAAFDLHRRRTGALFPRLSPGAHPAPRAARTTPAVSDPSPLSLPAPPLTPSGSASAVPAHPASGSPHPETAP